MSDSSKKTKVPGRVSALADARGGPANFAGVSFQVWVQVDLLLDKMLVVRGDPTSSVTVRCEARELIDGGQHGYDVAVHQPSSPARLIEVKSEPSKAEVLDVLARARRLAEDESQDLVGMVSGSETPQFTAFDRLHRHSREATDDATFEERVRAHGDAIEIEYYEALGEAPVTVMAQVIRPALQPVGPLVGQVRKVAALAAMPGRGEDLVTALREMVVDASTRRESLLVSDVVRVLTQRGLLAPAPVVTERPESAALMAVLVVLGWCPVPLPGSVLAAAAGMSLAELEALAAGHIAAGAIGVCDEGDYSMAVAREQRYGVEFGGELVAAVLKELCLSVERSGNPEMWAWQTPNADALASALGLRADRVVGVAFQYFDKACKAYGDLWVTERFARTSAEAISRVMQETLSGDDLRVWAYARAQTWICGHAWVWQRVGTLARAVELMTKAEGLARQFDDEDNLAFVLKCKGRLQRMRGEDAVVAGDHAAAEVLFDESVAMLEQAFPAFSKIVREKSRYVEDRGECVALLARTHASRGNLVDASEAIARAHPLLEGRPASKAYADLALLEAELAMPDDPAVMDDDADARAALRVHVEALDELVRTHERHSRPSLTGATEGGDAAGADEQRHGSEIVARVLLVRGKLRALLDDRDGGTEDVRAAVAIYETLRHHHALDRAAWDLIELSDDVLPEGLLAAFDRNGTTVGGRVFAVTYLQDLIDNGGLGGATDLPGGNDSDFWDGVVNRGVQNYVARTPNWDEGRETA